MCFWCCIVEQWKKLKFLSPYFNHCTLQFCHHRICSYTYRQSTFCWIIALCWANVSFLRSSRMLYWNWIIFSLSRAWLQWYFHKHACSIVLDANLGFWVFLGSCTLRSPCLQLYLTTIYLFFLESIYGPTIIYQSWRAKKGLPSISRFKIVNEWSNPTHCMMVKLMFRLCEKKDYKIRYLSKCEVVCCEPPQWLFQEWDPFLD